MKKNLLNVSSDLFNKFQQKPLRFFTSLVLVLVFGITTKTTAQCNYLYQGFESFRNSVVVTGATATTPVPVSGYNSGILGYNISASSNPYSGRQAINFLAGAYIISPKISSVTNQGTIRVSFFVRLAANNASPGILSVATSSNYSGSGIMTGATWTPLAMNVGPVSLTTTSWVYCYADITPGSAGVYLRILRTNAAGGTPVVDDLAWSSSIAAENSLIVMPTNNTYAATIGGASTSCYSTTQKAITFSVNPLNAPSYASPNTTDLASGSTYYLYDNGGNSDTTAGVAGSDSYNLNQNNTVLFTPASGDRIEFNNTLVTSSTGGTPTTGSLTLTRPSGTILSSTSTLATATSYAGNYCETSTLNYVTSAAGTTFGAGLYTEIKSSAPASCAAVTGLAVNTSNVTYSTIPVSWTQITGCSVPAGGYDYYVTTTSSTPPAGANTVINTINTQANNVPSGSATGVTVTGLTGGTIYKIWVRTNCGGTSYGAWQQIGVGYTAVDSAGTTYTGVVKTVCTPQNVTYTENFQGSLTAIPTCTSTTSGASGIANYSGNYVFYNSATGTSFLTQPVNLDSSKIYRLSYDYGNSTTGASAVFQIYYGSTTYTATTSNITTSIVPSVTGSSSTLTTGRYYFQPPSTGIYYIRFAYNSNVGGGSLLLDNIVIAEVPCYPAALATALSGPTSPCAATSVVYTITAPATANSSTPDSYTVTAPSGWVVTGTTGNTVTLFTGAIPGNITVVSNLAGCDSSLPVTFPVSTSAPPAQPSAITGSATVCSALPTTGLTYSVTNVAGTTYNWTFPSGWTQTAGGTTNSVTYTATAGAVSGTITVTPTIGGCTGTPRTLNVVVGTVTNSVCTSATAITTVASNTFRCSTRHFWYSFVPLCNGDYKVSLAGTGGDIDVFAYNSATYTCSGTNPGVLGTGAMASGVSAANTESVTLTGLVAGNTYYICVYEFVTPAGNGGSFNLSVLSNTLSTIGAISGISSVSCSSTTTTTYTVPAVTGATDYTWTLPSGWSGSSTTNSITVTSNGTTGGTISVVGNGACGSTVPATKSIAVGQVQPDSISGSTYLCSPFSATTYSVTPVEGAVSYIWTLPAGWSGSSTTNSISIVPNSTSGSITVKAVGPCGTSAAATLAITTKASVVTTNVAICANDPSAPMTSVISGVTTFSMANIPVGAPTFVRPLSSATGYTASGTTAIYGTIAIVPTVTGSYTFNGCDTSGRDTFMVIYDTSFNPASPGTNFLSANDDSGSSASCNVDPRITLTLTAGQTYIIVYTAFYPTTGFNAITSISGITITVTPPSGGLIQVGTTDWYDSPSGGTLLHSGNSFNPVGIDPLLPNTSLTYVGTHTYYATNSQASVCRTATTFTISNAPTQNITPGSSAICPNSYNAVSANATGTGVTTTWTSVPAGALFSDAIGTAYVAGTNTATVYVRSAVPVAVTAVSAVGTCSVSSTVNYTVSGSSTWDGFTSTWTPSAPTLNDAIIINNGWVDGDLQGCSCTVNSGAVVFYGGETLTLTNELKVLGGSVLFEDQSSLYQTSTATNTAGSYSGGNSGNITYKRISQAMFKYDYTYWSSPVYNQNLLALSPGSLHFYQYNYTTQAWQFIGPGNAMEVARGYIIRAPLTHPEMPFFPALDFTANFTGIPNNGTITYPITSGSAQMNLIGNPYPSAVAANDFISATANNNLTGTLYFWTHNTYINSFGQYVQADYATYNLSGGVAAAAGSGNNAGPSGTIASGQGFFVKGITGTPSGSSPYSVTFTNSMRRGGVNDRSNFYRNAQSVHTADDFEKNRFWLNITDNAGGFKQALIGYIENATDGLDRLYDGDFVDVGNAIVLYSVVDDNLLTIQGRQLPFNSNDLVPVGYKSLVNGNYTISLDHFDSYFNDQDIFIEDKLLGTIHNLKESPYIFSTDAGTFNERFVIRYTSDALNTPDISFNENTVRVYKNQSGLHVNTGAVVMSSVKIFDIRGRFLASREGINAAQTSFTTLPNTQQVLLVQVTSEEGEILTKKVVY